MVFGLISAAMASIDYTIGAGLSNDFCSSTSSKLHFSELNEESTVIFFFNDFFLFFG